MNIPRKLPFEQVNRAVKAAYPGVLSEWLPGGKLVGHEYIAINPTRADQTPGSFSVNVKSCKWSDFATGDAGGDPISLYAYLRCGGVENRVQACKELAEIYRVEETEPEPKKKPHLRVVKDEPEPEWKPLVPPPDGVPEPADRLAKYDHVFRYLDQDGQLLRYVVRNDRDKYIRPLTYGILNGEAKWDLRGPNDPKSLYHLEWLDERDVLLQEGELKTDEVAKLLPEYACLSLTGGTGNQAHTDLTPLAGKRVIYCGDNDASGRKCAEAVAARLTELGCAVLVVDVWSHDFEDTWDLGDAVKAGWTAETLRGFIQENAKPWDPDPGNVDSTPEPEEDKEDPADWGSDRDGIIPLGFNNNVFYYLPKRGGQVVALTPNGHSELQMRALASQAYWYGTRFKKEDGGIDWKAAAGYFMSACQDRPIYTPSSLRGTGAWIDGDHSVLNMGEHLIVDGVARPGMRLPGSGFVYERKASVNKTIASPVSTEEVGKLDGIIRDLRWEKPIFGKLMSGWLALAPICGALHWRPPIWVTGGSGAGKTTLDTNIVSPILEGLCERMASTSTEAGIRQRLGNNALPIIFDEAEAEGLTDKQRIQHILDLVRQATSEGAAAIVKGTQSQTGAISYMVRSCFMFMSINVSLNRQADESRITVLALENPPKGDPESQAHYDRLLVRVAQLVTPEFCAGFIARQVWLMPVIRDNAVTFSRAVSAELGSGRVGDQIGTLCAGYHSTYSSERISLESAIAWVKKQDWEGATAADAVTDEQRLVDKLLLRRLAVRSNSGGVTDRTVAELLAAAAGRDSDVNVVNANDALKRNGIIYQPANMSKNQACGMWVANRHDALADFLKDTPWASASSWQRALKRFPGSESGTSTFYFSGVYSRATFVPVNLPSPAGRPT